MSEYHNLNRKGDEMFKDTKNGARSEQVEMLEMELEALMAQTIHGMRNVAQELGMAGG
jgi:predicted hydrolase (HD superfamily)